MPRYGAKTYSRTLRAGTTSSKQFDELFSDSNVCRRPATRSSPTKASPTKVSPMKAHNAVAKQTAGNSAGLQTVRASRNSSEQSDLLSSPKRRRLDSGSDDPFSFSSDDDASRSPIKRNDARAIPIASQNKFPGIDTKPALRQTRASSAQALADSKIQTRSSGTAKPLTSTADRTKKQATIMRFTKKIGNSDLEQSAPEQKQTMAQPNSHDAIRTLPSSATPLNSLANRPHPKPASTNSVEYLSQVSNSSESSSALYSLNSTGNSNELSPKEVLDCFSSHLGSTEEDNVVLLSDGDNPQQSAASRSQSLMATLGSNAFQSQTSNLNTGNASRRPHKPAHQKLHTQETAMNSAKDEFDFTDSEESDNEEEVLTKNATAGRDKNPVMKKIFNSPKKVILM